jgi:hypothetical protein
MIELYQEVIKRTDLIGDDDFDLNAGQKLKIETSPNGEEILDVEVPVGKKWSVHVAVTISETDA